MLNAMDTEPLVTIAIPTYNRAFFLDEALQSVLAQTYRKLEILVSDNASTDGTSDIVRRYSQDERVHYQRHENNCGMVANWNSCLERAQGEFFFLLSDDDLLEKQAIQRLLEEFKDDSVVMAYSRYILVQADNNVRGISGLSPYAETGTAFITNSLAGKRDIVPSVTLHRTKDAVVLGGYPDIGNASDLAMRLGIARHGTVRFLKEPLVKYRVHGMGLSRSYELTTQTLVSFLAWIDAEDCYLHAYRSQAQEYCRHLMTTAYYYAALRGQMDAFHSSGSFLKRIDPGFSEPLGLRLLLKITAILRRYRCMEMIEDIARRIGVIHHVKHAIRRLMRAS